MKKILYAVFSIMLLASCGGGKAKVTESDKAEAREMLRTELEYANNTLAGKQVDFASFCDGCEFYNDEAHYYYTFNEDYITIQQLKDNAGELKQSHKEMIKNMPATKELCRLLEMIDGKIILHYTGDYSGQTVMITLDF